MPIRNLLLTLSTFSAALAHVALLYPAARYPPLDFLDSARTQSPCGMSRSERPFFTQFEVGKAYNLTWTNNLPHKGGIRLTLLDASERMIGRLTSADTGSDGDGDADSWLMEPNTTTFTSTVTFQTPCEDCVLLLERQALEYGPKYLFHSCADIRIFSAVEDTDEARCSGNGRYTAADDRCSCHHNFAGEACQFRVDCSSDGECSNGGRCVEASKPSVVQATCYCAWGFFGRNCESAFDSSQVPENEFCFNYQNLVDTGDSPKFPNYGIFNPECYQKVGVSDEDFVYSRSIGEEVEIILDFSTTSWVSIGWRPLNLDPSCRLFPEIGLPRSRTFRQVASASNGFLSSAFRATLHPMDCVDIVTGTVVDGRSHIDDMYTRDRSTPLRDHFFEGENSLSAAFGVERDGRTIVMFRRNVREIEPTDHPLGPGKIFGIYAKGASHGIEDSFAYHGPQNRGIALFEFVKPGALSEGGGSLVYVKKPISKSSGINSTSIDGLTFAAGVSAFSLDSNGSTDSSGVIQSPGPIVPIEANLAVVTVDSTTTSTTSTPPLILTTSPKPARRFSTKTEKAAAAAASQPSSASRDLPVLSQILLNTLFLFIIVTRVHQIL